jgi:hypothetical protein
MVLCFLYVFFNKPVLTLAAGMLATSRGFGDASLKPVVLATPEIFARSKEADDVAIVRASFLHFHSR